MKSPFVLFLFLFISPLKAQEKVLTVASDVWCPYICSDQKSPGFLVELLKEIALKNGLTLKFLHIPLARALKLANVNKIDVVLALSSDHFINRNLQQSKQYFGVMFNDFYVNANDTWRYKNVKDLDYYLKQKKLVGIIYGYEYGEVLATKLEKNKSNVYKASGDSPLAKLMRMVHLKRLGVLLDSRYTIQYELKQTQDYEITYAGTEGNAIPLYLGFSSSVDKNIIGLFDHGLVKMRKSGKLTEILAKYGAKDWDKKLVTHIQ